MAIINDKFRQEIHKEVDRILNKLEEQERFLAQNGRSLTQVQIRNAFSGLDQYSAVMSSHFVDENS